MFGVVWGWLLWWTGGNVGRRVEKIVRWLVKEIKELIFLGIFLVTISS